MDQTRGGNTGSGNDDGRASPIDVKDIKEVGRQVKDQAGTLVREAREQGSQMLGEVGEHAQGIFDQGKSQIADQVRAVAESLKNGCAPDRDAAGIGRYAQQAGDRLMEFADTIRDASPRDLGRKAEGFARQRPEVFLGWALVTGVLIGRFLRSHQPREDSMSDGNLGNAMPDRERRFSDSSSGSSGGFGQSGYGAGSEIGSAGPGIGAAATGLGPTIVSPGACANEDDTSFGGGFGGGTEGGV